MHANKNILIGFLDLKKNHIVYRFFKNNTRLTSFKCSILSFIIPVLRVLQYSSTLCIFLLDSHLLNLNVLFLNEN